MKAVIKAISTYIYKKHNEEYVFYRKKKKDFPNVAKFFAGFHSSRYSASLTGRVRFYKVSDRPK